MRVIPSLGSLRGESWHKLIGKVSSEHAELTEQLAFVLMMVRLGGCITCSSDSFRAMRGCSQCSWQTIRRFRGSDHDLVEQFEQCCREVEQFLASKKQ